MGRGKWTLFITLVFLINFISCSVLINVSSKVEVSPETLDFGIMPVTQALTIPVEITNTGEKDVFITSAMVVYLESNPVQSEVTITEGKITDEVQLSKGMKHYVDVTYIPARTRAVKAELRIEYRSGTRVNRVVLPITGQGAEISLTVTPRYHDFKHTYLNTTKTKVFTIRNVANKTITVSTVELVDFGADTTSEDIYISSGWNGSFKVLQFAESFDVEVTFTPQTIAEKKVKLRVVVAHSIIDFYSDIVGWGANTLEFVTNSPLPEGVKGSTYETQLEAAGGDGNYTFSLLGDELPFGLLMSKDGLISGTPSDNGEFNFDVVLTDGSGNKVQKNFALKITFASLVRDSADYDPVYIFSEGDDEGLFSVNLINAGVSALTITGISLSGDGATSGEATLLNQPTTPTTMQPSDTVNITIHVESMLVENRSVQLTVSHTGYNSPYVGDFRWKVEGDKYIFIIDASGSMLTKHNVSYPVFNQDGNIILDPTRWEVAVYDISRVLASLDTADKFEVIIFDDDLHYFFGQMDYANGSHRYDSIAWLFNYPVNGCSNMYDGMYNGFHNYGTLARMYVYSDGGANTAKLLGCGGCACGGWIGTRTYQDCQTWVPAMAGQNSDFHLYMLQYAASPTSFMQQIGTLSNCTYQLK